MNRLLLSLFIAIGVVSIFVLAEIYEVGFSSTAFAATAKTSVTFEEPLLIKMPGNQDIDPRPPVEGDPRLLRALESQIDTMERVIRAQEEMACACYGNRAPEDCR